MKHAARALGSCLAHALSLGSLAASAQQATLRIFTGGQQRPDVMRQIVDLYSQRNPGIRVEVEVGGATSDQQRQYLNTVLAAKHAALDVILIDVIRPAQWAAQGWAEPLDSYLGAERTGIRALLRAAAAPASALTFDRQGRMALFFLSRIIGVSDALTAQGLSG